MELRGAGPVNKLLQFSLRFDPIYQLLTQVAPASLHFDIGFIAAP
jgi:hypothetical protein